jgi:hypothetical protein
LPVLNADRHARSPRRQGIPINARGNPGKVELAVW